MIPTKLQEFFNRLDAHTDAVPMDVLKAELERLDLTVEDIKDYVSFCKDHYKRNRIHIGPAYHALALCWGPNQISPIHDHAGSGCGVLVVTGHAVETRFNRGEDGMLSERDTQEHPVGGVCASFDADIHALGNASADEPLVTLHIYSPPLLEWGVYSRQSNAVQRGIDAEIDTVQPATT